MTVGLTCKVVVTVIMACDQSLVASERGDEGRDRGRREERDDQNHGEREENHRDTLTFFCCVAQWIATDGDSDDNDETGRRLGVLALVPSEGWVT